MNIKAWLYDARHTMFLVFVVFAIVASITAGYAVLIPFLAALIVGAIADLLFIRYSAGGWGFPSSGLVTGGIVGLVSAYTTPLWLIALVVVIAISSKLIAWKGRHFFNPANFGILLGVYFLGLSTAWWGASSIVLTVLLGLFIVTKTRKWWVVIPFLVVYCLIRVVILGDAMAALLETIAPAVLFFALIMLIEPRTSPTKRIPQTIYGVLAAILAVALASVPGDLHLALALANLSVPFLRIWIK